MRSQDSRANQRLSTSTYTTRQTSAFAAICRALTTSSGIRASTVRDGAYHGHGASETHGTILGSGTIILHGTVRIGTIHIGTIHGTRILGTRIHGHTVITGIIMATMQVEADTIVPAIMA